MKKMSMIRLGTSDQKEAITLFYEFVGNSPSLRHVRWGDVYFLVLSDQLSHNHINKALRLGAVRRLGCWGRREGECVVTPSEGRFFNVKLTNWTGLQSITVMRDDTHSLDEYWRIIIDY